VNTIYDLTTLALFAGLVVLFLQRSATPATPDDHLYQYLPPAVGLAFANWLGNHEQHVLAVATILAAVAYVFVVLKPFRQKL
jgi:hypothetical protein